MKSSRRVEEAVTHEELQGEPDNGCELCGKVSKYRIGCSQCAKMVCDECVAAGDDEEEMCVYCA